MQFKEWLQGHLTEIDRSQGWLARKLGVTSASVGHWLSGKTTPKQDKTARICKALATEMKVESYQVWEDLFLAVYSDEEGEECT